MLFRSIATHMEKGDRVSASRAHDRCRAIRSELGYPELTRDTTILLDGRPASQFSASADTPPAADGFGRTEPRRDTTRIGVLPLRPVDPNGSHNVETLASGFSEELVTLLAQFRWISCVSGSSLGAIGQSVGNTAPN